MSQLDLWLTPEGVELKVLAAVTRALADPVRATEIVAEATERLQHLAAVFADDAAHGARLREAAKRGAAETNAPRTAASRRIRSECIRSAKALLERPLPTGVRFWTVPILAAEVRFAWKLDGDAPAPRTVEQHLRVGMEQGDLPAWLKIRGGAPESRRRGRNAP